MTDFVPLNCSLDILEVLEAGLTRFGPADGAPDWLISGVWLCCGDSDFFATGSVEVLADGYVARPLVIDIPERIAAEIEEAIPDIQGRLVSRGSNTRLPDHVNAPAAPETLQAWPAEAYSTSILLRVAASGLLEHRIGCALLFTSPSQKLLVGTDKTTLAMVLSQDEQLIDRYRRECEELSPAQYRELVGSRPAH